MELKERAYLDLLSNPRSRVPRLVHNKGTCLYGVLIDGQTLIVGYMLTGALGIMLNID